MDPYIMEALGISPGDLDRKRYQKTPIPQRLRQSVFCRDLHQCQYCGARNRPLCIDHVTPECKGGEMVEENLVTSCRPCNLSKGSKTGKALKKWKAARKSTWRAVQ
jgi:5-methylcytosine-specific restriction endonuclease McrA